MIYPMWENLVLSPSNVQPFLSAKTWVGCFSEGFNRIPERGVRDSQARYGITQSRQAKDVRILLIIVAFIDRDRYRFLAKMFSE